MAHTLPDALIDILVNPFCTRCGDRLPTRPVFSDTGRYCSVGCAEADEADWDDVARQYLERKEKKAAAHG